MAPEKVEIQVTNEVPPIADPADDRTLFNQYCEIESELRRFSGKKSPKETMVLSRI